MKPPNSQTMRANSIKSDLNHIEDEIFEAIKLQILENETEPPKRKSEPEERLSFPVEELLTY